MYDLRWLAVVCFLSVISLLAVFAALPRLLQRLKSAVPTLAPALLATAAAAAVVNSESVSREPASASASPAVDVSAECLEACYEEQRPRAVVFLDVDGVLNSLAFDDPLPPGQVEPRCVRLLGELLEASGASIVLSTSWRSSADLKRALFNALRAEGVPPLAVVGQTLESDFFFVQRAHEIREWLVKHPGVQSWVAIDDMDVQADLPEFFDGHFVQTEAILGLSENDVARAREMLLIQFGDGKTDEVCPLNKRM